MAVAFDAPSSGGNVGNQATLTWSHTCTGADRAIGVGVSNADVAEPTGVTYAAVALTKIAGASGTVPVDGDGMTIWASVGFQPASGANDVVVTFGSGQVDLQGGAMSVTGANQTNCVSNSNTATGTSTSPAVTVTTAADEVIYAHIISITAVTCAPGANETELYEQNNGGTTIAAHGYRQLGSDGGAITPTLSGSSEWRIGAISFKSTAVPTAVLTGTMVTGGVTEAEIVSG